MHRHRILCGVPVEFVEEFFGFPVLIFREILLRQKLDIPGNQDLSGSGL
jgi:hypothetical protein